MQTRAWILRDPMGRYARILRDPMGRYARWELSMFDCPTEKISCAQIFDSRKAARQYLQNHHSRRGWYRILRVEVKL